MNLRILTDADIAALIPLLTNHRIKQTYMLPDFDREAVIARCVELKRNVVMEDEFDTGERMKLNLGHTFGHGIEAVSHFTVSHGKAVAIGMAMAARCAKCSDADRIIACLQKFSCPTGHLRTRPV